MAGASVDPVRGTRACSAGLVALALLTAHAPVWGQAASSKRGSDTRGLYERSVVEVAPAANVALGLVHIDNRLGDVRIVGHDGPGVIIEAMKRAPNADTLDRLKVRLVPDPNGAINISTYLAMGAEARPIRAGSVRIDLVVRAPRTSRAVARVWNGRISLAGMEAGAELGSNVGDIEVRNASGTIITKSGRGAQRFNEVVGTVDAQGLAGNMDFQLIRGKRLDASVYKGNIVARNIRSRNVNLRTTRGDVRLRAQPVFGGLYYAASYYGNVEVTFARATAVKVWAKATRGKATIAGMRSRTRRSDRAVVGSHGSQRAPSMVRIQSGFGDIRFRLVPN